MDYHHSHVVLGINHIIHNATLLTASLTQHIWVPMGMFTETSSTETSPMETSSKETLPMETSQMESSLMDTLQTGTGHSAEFFFI